MVQAEEERPHQQDDYNLGHRPDLHVLVPSSSHSAHWQGRLELWFSFFFSCLSFLRDGCWLELLCICLGLDGQTSALLWGWGGAPATKQTLFLVLFLFSKTDEPDDGACPLRGGVTWLPWPLLWQLLCLAPEDTEFIVHVHPLRPAHPRSWSLFSYLPFLTHVYHIM